MNTKTTFCERCRALRWVEDWSDRRDEILSIVLGPCGHVIERTARLEWSIPERGARGRMHHVRATRERAPVAAS
jgi:hypothetical protein